MDVIKGDEGLLTDDYGLILTALYGTDGLTMDEIQGSVFNETGNLLIPINRINSLLSDLIFKKKVSHHKVRNKATRQKETRYFLVQKEGE